VAAPTADLRFGTIPRMAAASAAAWPDELAVVDGAARLTFADVAAEMHAVAAALLAAGIERGDRVALWAPNSASWITAALGIQGAGAWLVPLNTRFKADEAAYVLDRTDAAALFVVEAFMDIDYAGELTRAAPGLRALRNVIRIPAPGTRTSESWRQLLSAGGDHVEHADAAIAATGADDISDVIFTSGTTGKPKGVMLRHGTSLRCYESFNEAYGLGEGSRHLITTPFFHCFGYKAGWMVSLMTGATTYPKAVFDADETLTLVATEGITHMPGAPTVFSSLIDAPSRADTDLSSLDTAIVAAATIPIDLVREMSSELRFRTVMSGYGLTENHALGTFTRRTDPIDTAARTVGHPAPGIELRIVDDQGVDQPTDTQGELLIGGYAHMSGYYDEPEATAEVLHDGWLHTGDIGAIDTDGRLRITDRKKDMLIVGGFNVSPAEVECALLRMDGLAQAAVVGVPDARLGEVACAYVVPVAGAHLEPDAVVAFARAAMANYKVPRRVHVVDSLPTNATGKVQRHLLRDAARRTTTTEEVR
jgi:acyl-CoA synthetase (AMP-forming)/AMP-acid ligase II